MINGLWILDPSSRLKPNALWGLNGRESSRLFASFDFIGYRIRLERIQAALANVQMAADPRMKARLFGEPSKKLARYVRYEPSILLLNSTGGAKKRSKFH